MHEEARCSTEFGARPGSTSNPGHFATMAKKKKLFAGVGAKCSVLTKYLHPKKTGLDDKHRTTCILKEMRTIKVNRKDQECFVFDENGVEYHAVMRFFNVLEEGEERHFFFPEEAQAQKTKEAAEAAAAAIQFKEPKVKWKKSKAKRILYDLLRDGTVPLVQKDSNGTVTMPIEEIFALDEEFALYDPDKFPSRLGAL